MTRAVQTICLLASLLIPAAQVEAQANFETTRIADGVYHFRWQEHYALFLTTPEGVVVFDPINPDAARQLGKEIKRIAPGLPLAALVYSHSDTDHATGAPALFAEMGQEDVPIIAHENAVPVIRDRASPDQPLPTMTFSERMAFEIGGRRVELHYLGRSHTDNLIVPLIPDVGVVFVVDFIVGKDQVGWRDMETWYLPDFFDVIASLLRLPFETVVFGHDSPGDRATIQRQIAYYDDLTAAVRQAIAEGLTEEEAAAQIRLPKYADWVEYDAWLPLNVGAVYRWLTSEG